MTQEQKKEFFLFLQKFCLDNAGNRLNEWIIEAFLNRANQKLEEILLRDYCGAGGLADKGATGQGDIPASPSPSPRLPASPAIPGDWGNGDRFNKCEATAPVSVPVSPVKEQGIGIRGEGSRRDAESQRIKILSPEPHPTLNSDSFFPRPPRPISTMELYGQMPWRPSRAESEAMAASQASQASQDTATRSGGAGGGNLQTPSPQPSPLGGEGVEG